MGPRAPLLARMDGTQMRSDALACRAMPAVAAGHVKVAMTIACPACLGCSTTGPSVWLRVLRTCIAKATSAFMTAALCITRTLRLTNVMLAHCIVTRA